MAQLSTSRPLALAAFLPSFGQSRPNLPIWNEGSKMFIIYDYESEAGHRYYYGARLSGNIVIVEKFSHWNTWTFINEIDMFCFDGKSPKLIQSKTFDKEFRTDDFVRETSVRMLEDYLSSQCKLAGTSSPEEVRALAESTVAQSYISLLDPSYSLMFNDLLPLLKR